MSGTSAGQENDGAAQGTGAAQRRQVTGLFADMVGFTPLAEKLGEEKTYLVMQRLHRELNEAVHAQNGTVQEMTGDGVMALFGLETAPDQACRQALAAARGMAAGMDDLNRLLRNDLEDPLRIGIGIHIGTVIVGEMGYAETMSVTAIGDAVNTASRLEDMTKELGGQLVVSESVARRAGVDPADDDIDFRITQGNVVLEVLDADRLVHVPGRHHPVDHLLPDPARPTSDLLVGHQRHRPQLTGALTALTALVENRSDVPTERDPTRRLGVCRSRGGQQ